MYFSAVVAGAELATVPPVRYAGPGLSHPLFTLRFMNVSADRDVSSGEFPGPAGRIYADDWLPDFGPSRDASGVRNLAGQVDVAVQTDRRRALPGLVSERFTEAAADGVRRADVRLTADGAVQESRTRFGGCVRGRVGAAASRSPVRYPCLGLSHPLFTLPFMNVSSDRDVSASAGHLRG